MLAIVGVPLLIAGALGTLNPVADPLAGSRPPQLAPLASIDLVCPSPLGASPSISVTQAGPNNRLGGVVVANSGDRSPLRVPRGTVVSTPTGEGPRVVSGVGANAPGLSAALSQDRPRAVTGCAVPEAELWFSGLGAGPTHGSVIELINPEQSNGVADITIFSEEGILDVPELRGIAVPGNSSTHVALAEILPRRGQLGAQVTVSRGRLGVWVSDQNDELGGGAVSTEWVPAQPAPATSNVLLGIPDAGQHQLVMINPGADEAVVSVQVITPAAPFAPAGVAQLQVPPESVGVLSLSDVISEVVGGEGPDGLGLVVEANTPIATSLRSLVAGDLSFTGPAELVQQGWQLVPHVRAKDRTADLVLWGGAEPVTGTVRILDADGADLVERQITLAPRAADQVTVPLEAAVVELVSAQGIAAAISVSGKRGSVVVSLRPALTNSLIPDVRPALR